MGEARKIALRVCFDRAIPRHLYLTILNRIRRFAAIPPRAAPI
jgi:hypothetical protein